MKLGPNSILRLSAIAIACTATAYAADFTWDGGTGVWTDINWNSGASAGPTAWSGDTAIINSGQVSTTAGDQTGGINLNIGGGTLDSGGNYMRVEANTTLQGGSIIIGRAFGSYNAGWFGGALGGTITVSGSVASSITGGSYTGQDINMGTLTTFDVGDVTTGTDLTVGVALTDYFNGSWQSSSLVKNGAGTLALTANNNYAGTTTVGGGVLDLSTGIIYRYAGWNNRSISINNGGTVRLSNWGDGNADTAGGFGQIGFGAANILLDNGTLEYVGGGPSGNMDRSFTIGAGGATLVANGSATWQITDAGRGFALASSGGTLTLSGPSNGLISKAIEGGGGLTKSGVGTWTLSGANTYSGNTTINGGKLVINGSTSTSVINVESGGTLGGSGTVGAATTIKDGGHLAVGNSAGNQTFSSTLELQSGSIFDWDLAGNTTSGPGTNFDSVNVTGTLTIASDAVFRVIQNTGLDFNDTFWDSTQTWNNIFTAGTLTSNWSDAAVSVYDINGAPQNVSSYGAFTVTGSTLTWTAVPEPSSSLLSAMLITAGLLRRRR